MPRILYLTTELPYFPGQGGMMALHVGHLVREEYIGVVGPRYAHQPESSLQSLRDTVHKSYWWPEHPVPGATPVDYVTSHPPIPWLKWLPKRIKKIVWRSLAGLSNYSDDALAWRMALVNLAPKLLEALDGHRWNVVLLSQSTSAPWFRFLPATLARCVYFHDIRSDYLRRAPTPPPQGQLQRILAEERLAATQSDAIAFISELDRNRAATLLRPSAPAAVVPICLNLDYFSRQPAISTELVVLFTGHLAHPPNVDAVLYFLGAIWPRIVAAQAAVFRVVGLQPAPELIAAMARSPSTVLVPNAPDIRPHFQSARVYVVPMRFGGGVRQKILEAWAIGIPVVTTTMGAEGIAAKDGENCWIRDQPGAFADQILALLHNPAPLGVLDAARTHVETHHSARASCPVMAGQLKAAVMKRRQQPPRVLYDLRWLLPGKSGGVEQMTRELVDEIASFDRTFHYRFHGSRQLLRRWRFPAGFSHRMICPDDPGPRWAVRRDAIAQSLAVDLSLPPLTSPALRALEWYARLDCTVVHGLPCLVHPDLRRFPSVVTMHDLQHLHRPEFFSPEDIAIREWEYRESCRLADHVICTSEFTRQDVHQRYGVSLDKLTTIWNLPPRLTGSRLEPNVTRRLLESMGITHRFLFFPAQPWQHKNHAGLLAAIRLIKDELPRDLKLVLTGQPFPLDHPATPLLLDPEIAPRVAHLGYRTPLEIVALYAAAEALIFPSLFEGFGMPVIEAMQQGCPVVCGSHTSLPEIAGEAALFVDVSSPTALADGILRITRDEALAKTMTARGTENLRRFDRRSLAEKTRAIYATVHENHFA
jgi:glycosyltransferase involved in cell wall biosynthesis